MIRFIGLFPSAPAALFFVCVLALGSDGHAAERNLTVVELFTSQGCSSCPPADAFLGELVDEDNVLPLSLHVDYWDYIGWKDPFGDPANTTRQRDYAARLALRYVYTPQMVVQGRWQDVGSKRGAIWPLIRTTQRAPGIAVDISIAADKIHVRVAETKTRPDATVWLITFDARRDTKIARGENGGRTLSHFNVMRSMTEIGRWNGPAFETVQPLPASLEGKKPGIAVLVQEAGSGPILGAAQIRSEDR